MSKSKKTNEPCKKTPKKSEKSAADKTGVNTEETQKQENPQDNVDHLEQELKDYKNKYLLLLAESENARKRLQKERQEMTKHSISNIILEFLSPLDNLENALQFTQNMSDDVKNWATGFQMILSQFKETLANNNVHTFKSEGQQFDPHLHDAIETIESEQEPEGKITKEYLRGYKMGERVIRPARVQVVKAPKKEEPKENPQTEPSPEEESEIISRS